MLKPSFTRLEVIFMTELAIENLPAEEFLSVFGISIDDILDNLDIIKGLKKPEKKVLPGESLLFKHAIDDYLSLLSAKLSEKTIETYRTELEGLLNFVKERWDREGLPYVVSNITEIDVSLYLNRRNPHKKEKNGETVELEPSTYNKKRGILATFFKKYLVRRGYIEESPVDEIRRAQEGELHIRFLTKKEQKKVLGIAAANTESGLRDFIIIYLDLHTGLRLAEICDLNISDVMLKENTLIVRKGKGNKRREIFINDEVVRVLTDYIKKMHFKAGPFKEIKEIDLPLFVQIKGKNAFQRISREAVKKMIVRVFRKAGIKQGATHRIRHSYAVNALHDGLSIREISFLLGHSNVSTTFRYLKLSNEQILRKIKEDFPLAFISCKNIVEDLQGTEGKNLKKAIARIEELT